MVFIFFFFFNDTATTEIYTLSLHDALPISSGGLWTSSGTTGPTASSSSGMSSRPGGASRRPSRSWTGRSEEHTSELQSRQYLVCRLLLEKKKKQRTRLHTK